MRLASIGSVTAGFIVGSILMLVYSFTLYQRSRRLRESDAKAWRKVLSITLVFLVMSCFFILFDAFAFRDAVPGFPSAFVSNIILIACLSLFDAIFIDIVVLVLWRPKCLKKKGEYPSWERMRKHVLIQLTLGWIFKLPMAAFSAFVYSAIAGE